MQITLKINGEDKTFRASFVSGRMLRKTLEINKKVMGKVPDANMLDEMVGYVVDLFDGQFTIDEFYDGIESNKVFSTITDCITQVTGQVDQKLEQFKDPN